MTMIVRRFALSIACGAILPLAFIGSLLMQGEPHLQHSDRAAFYALLPALLFGIMACAIWILMQRPVSSVRR